MVAGGRYQVALCLLTSSFIFACKNIMDQAVFQTLTDTLSADTNTRLAAELRLKELRVNPGTLHPWPFTTRETIAKQEGTTNIEC